MVDHERNWYVKIADGREFGPVESAKLVSWARDGRLDSDSRVSSDRQTWKPAPLLPELGMEWIIEMTVGQYYGPMHQDVLSNLQREKAIPPTARIYRLAGGESAPDEARLKQAERKAAVLEAQVVKLTSELATARAKAEKKKSSGGLFSWFFSGSDKTPDLSLLEAAARHELMMARQRKATPLLSQAKPREAEIIEVESV